MENKINEQMYWRPIDTCPKDPYEGNFLIYDASAPQRKIKIAEWFPAGSASGVRDISGGGFRRNATHWMPLPEPPNGK